MQFKTAKGFSLCILFAFLVPFGGLGLFLRPWTKLSHADLVEHPGCRKGGRRFCLLFQNDLSDVLSDDLMAVTNSRHL